MKKLNIKLSVNPTTWMNNRWVRICLSIPLFAAGVLIGFVGYKLKDPFVIAGGFMLMSGGVLVMMGGMRLAEARHIGDNPAKGEPQRNTLEICSGADGLPGVVKFTYVDHPLGQNFKCLNDNLYYFLHLVRGDNVQLLTLPDEDDRQRGYDPAEFANPISMPCSKKYLNWSATLWQTVSVVVLVIVIIGELIALIAIV